MGGDKWTLGQSTWHPAHAVDQAFSTRPAKCDASGWEATTGDRATSSHNRQAYDEKGRARHRGKQHKGLGLQRLGASSPDVPDGGPWDNSVPEVLC